jgi:hypothetical protein
MNKNIIGNKIPERDLTIVKSEQMEEVLAKLNNIEKNLDLLLAMLKDHIPDAATSSKP